MNRFRLILNQDGKTAKTPGVSWGYGHPYLNIIYSCNDMLVLHKPTSSDFGGRSYSEIFPAMYMLAKWVDSDYVEVIKEESPGRHWKACRDKFIKECQE